MKKQFILAVLLASFVFFGCAMIPDAGTQVYVYEKMRRVQPGNTPEQVVYLLSGPPTYVTALNEGMNTYEVWEYRVGNFLHAETAIIIFKNGRVMALPKNSQELLGNLYSAGVVRDAQFWNNQDR